MQLDGLRFGFRGAGAAEAVGRTRKGHLSAFGGPSLCIPGRWPVSVDPVRLTRAVGQVPQWARLGARRENLQPTARQPDAADRGVVWCFTQAAQARLRTGRVFSDRWTGAAGSARQCQFDVPSPRSGVWPRLALRSLA